MTGRQTALRASTASSTHFSVINLLNATSTMESVHVLLALVETIALNHCAELCLMGGTENRARTNIANVRRVGRESTAMFAKRMRLAML